MLKRAEIRRAALGVLGRESVSSLLRPFASAAAILTLHRFAMPDLGIAGDSPAALRANLEFLRRHRFRLLPLADLVALLRSPSPDLARVVCFTVDDAYADFLHVGAPVFEAYDCPVTVFVPTGFVDGAVWLWWNRVEHCLLHTDRSSVSLGLAGSISDYRLENPVSRRAAAVAIVDRLERVADDERLRALDALEAELDVALPAMPPPPYAAMTWEQVRALGRRGFSFGPHTIDHPILSQLPIEQAGREIGGSWARLREETDAAVGVFAYPNGQQFAFSEREEELVRRVGIGAAVTTRPGFIASSHGMGGRRLTALPRIAYPGEPAEFAPTVNGTLRARLAIGTALRAAPRR